MMDYFDEIFNQYKKRGNVKSFEDTKWAKATAVRGELGMDATTYPGETMTRIEYIRKWAHMHVKVKVVGVFDTVGSIGISGYVEQPGTDVGFYSTTLHPSGSASPERHFTKILMDTQKLSMLSTHSHLTNLAGTFHPPYSTSTKPAAKQVSICANAGSRDITAT